MNRAATPSASNHRESDLRFITFLPGRAGSHLSIEAKRLLPITSTTKRHSRARSFGKIHKHIGQPLTNARNGDQRTRGCLATSTDSNVCNRDLVDLVSLLIDDRDKPAGPVPTRHDAPCLRSRASTTASQRHRLATQCLCDCSAPVCRR